MKAASLRIWLRPGLRIKRWIALGILCMITISLALAMFAAWIYRNYDVPAGSQTLVRIITLQFVPHPMREIGLLLVAGLALVVAFVQLSKNLMAPFLAQDDTGRDIAEIVKEHRFGPIQPELNVVAIGGGTGLSALLRGLKLADNIHLTAIVTVADDGGSTGRIRTAYNIPAPGDIRNCLVAMADDESTMGRLFDYRFSGNDELAGHAFGNLFITAMTQVSGSFDHAVIESARVLNVRGKVMPSTIENIDLCAYMNDGEIVRGESGIAHDERQIDRIFLSPELPDGYEPSLEAILNADLIVLGPGSLYTSVLPNLLVEGVDQAIKWSGGSTAYVCNVATQHGETDHFGYREHIREVVKYLGENRLDYAIVNNNPAAAGVAVARGLDVEAVDWDGEETLDGVTLIAADVVSDRNPLRHDPAKLADVLLAIARQSREASLNAPRPTIEAMREGEDDTTIAA
jgi:uncharacterized cofD-like protein